MPRACGASSTLRLRGSIIDVSGILVHPPSRVMTAGCVARDHSFAISPHLLREFYPDRSALSYQRAQGMPGARCARSRACSVESTRVSHHGHTGKRPAFPAQWFYGLFRALVSANSARMCERAALVKPPVAGSEPVSCVRPREPDGERGTDPVSSSTRTVAWASSPDRARKGIG